MTGQTSDDKDDPETAEGALALAVGYYNPQIHAKIDDLAHVDAAGTISVTATTTIPFEFPTSVSGIEGDIVYDSGNPSYNPLNFVTGLITDGAFGIGSDIFNNSATSQVSGGSKSKVSLGGKILVYYYINDTEATIGDALINQKTNDPNASRNRRRNLVQELEGSRCRSRPRPSTRTSR